MDNSPINFTPNLEFISTLPLDLKIEYFEQYEEASRKLIEFSDLLKHTYAQHQNVLKKNIELYINAEILKRVVDQQSNKQINADIGKIQKVCNELKNKSKNETVEKASNKNTLDKIELLEETYCSQPDIEFN